MCENCEPKKDYGKTLNLPKTDFPFSQNHFWDSHFCFILGRIWECSEINGFRHSGLRKIPKNISQNCILKNYCVIG